MQLADMQQQHATNISQQPPVFRIDSAAKLLPKLLVESEIETYFIMFERTANLHGWPSNKWVAILQTQLKGKCLRVVTELSETDGQDYDILKKALVTAFEICPEQHRKKFRTLVKSTGETFAEWSFKLSACFKRWLVGIDAFDVIERLRETMLMEQFLTGVPNEVMLWLKDQKP